MDGDVLLEEFSHPASVITQRTVVVAIFIWNQLHIQPQSIQHGHGVFCKKQNYGFKGQYELQHFHMQVA